MTVENKALSPRRRFLAGLLKGKRGRRVSVGNPTSIICAELMERMKVYFPQAHHDPALMAELASGGYTVLGFDTITPVFSIQQEAAALGCEVDWGGVDLMPSARSHPFKETGRADIPADILEKPSMRVVLDALSLLRREYGDKVAIVGKAMGPWTLAYHAVGVEDFLRMLITDPDKARQLLKQYREVTVTFANAQIRAGADAIVIPDHATGSMVSAKVYRDFLVPEHREMLPRIGGPTILHICGKCADRLDIIAGEDFDGYHFEWQIDTKEAVRIADGRIALVGNISNVKALFQGTPDDVRDQARYAIEAGIDILAPECAVPPQTPLENLKAIVVAAQEGY